jgi:hypothetical protein
MISDESKAKVEKLIRFPTGVFNENLPADLYVYYHPTLHLFDSFEDWSNEENKIEQHNLKSKRMLNSKLYLVKKNLNLAKEPTLLNSLSYFDKGIPVSSGTFKIGVTNSSPTLTKEERAYLNDFKKSLRKAGYQASKVRFSRHRDHTMHGWTRVKNLKLNKGKDAMALERNVLRWVRKDLESKPFLTKKHLPQSGWTETIDASEIDLSTLWNKVMEMSKVFK